MTGIQDNLIGAVRENRLSDEQRSQLETILVAASNLDSAVDPEAEWHEGQCRVPVWASERPRCGATPICTSASPNVSRTLHGTSRKVLDHS